MRISRIGDEKQQLEIWDVQRKVQSVDLSAPWVPHGRIYEPENSFGALEWSFSDSCIAYVAEAKQAKGISFFEGIPSVQGAQGAQAAAGDGQPDGGNKEKGQKEEGSQHLFREDWGEAMVGKHHPVLSVYNIDTQTIRVFDLPEQALHEDGERYKVEATSVGQPVWAPDDTGLVFVGWRETPFRLGLTYCQNRPSALFYLDFQSYILRRLSLSDAACARSPRFSPDRSKLVWLENTLENGPHVQCSRLF